jgi:acyl carrier protein
MSSLQSETRMATEAQIRVWCVEYLRDTFKLPPDQVDMNAKFARFGMDSAMAVDFALALEEWLQIEILADAVYEYPTVNELAHYLAGRLASV